MPAHAGPAGEDEEDDPHPALPVMHLNLGTAVVERDNFDRWLFGQELSERARQEYLKGILDAKINLAARAQELTDPQRAKLRLAGRGDIKRFFDEVQKRRDDFEIHRMNFNTGLRALQRLDALSTRYREGPFGDGSLFAKTLNRINNDRTAGH